MVALDAGTSTVLLQLQHLFVLLLWKGKKKNQRIDDNWGNIQSTNNQVYNPIYKYPRKSNLNPYTLLTLSFESLLWFFLSTVCFINIWWFNKTLRLLIKILSLNSQLWTRSETKYTWFVFSLYKGLIVRIRHCRQMFTGTLSLFSSAMFWPLQPNKASNL
jgi:hypothetical protein